MKLKQQNDFSYQGEIPLSLYPENEAWLRLDPPASSNQFTLTSLAIDFQAPLFTLHPKKPTPFHIGSAHLGKWTPTASHHLLFDKQKWGAFALSDQHGEIIASSNPDEQWWYVSKSGEPKSLSLQHLPYRFKCEKNLVEMSLTAQDEDKTRWTFTRILSYEKHGDVPVISIRSHFHTSQQVRLLHGPLHTFFFWRNSNGVKRQALLPGVEYLENEPSSNEKEIRGSDANRRIVHPVKICYPLMALTQRHAGIALQWDQSEIAAVFDTPDRIFHSGGHLFGLWLPAVGPSRRESEFDIYQPLLTDGNTMTARIALSSKTTISEILSEQIATGLLPLHEMETEDPQQSYETLARGWLRSALRSGAQWRHAYCPPTFNPGLAPDVPPLLTWLGKQVTNQTLKAELFTAAKETLAATPPETIGRGGISHIQRPAGPLVFGDTKSFIQFAAAEVSRLSSLLANGTLPYSPGKVDYAATLGANHCNGFTAIHAEQMLQMATWTGNEEQIQRALSTYDRMIATYQEQVPRGAQPWEMPLHTPDIVAAARLVRCATLAFLLRGEQKDRETARYWAYSGISMVYLPQKNVRRTDRVGAYATIGVMGATNWTSPNWIGLPVQWCGLVYSAALADLADIETDPKQRKLWQRLSHGISMAGVRMCFPATDRLQQGLLPDYFHLLEQIPDGAAINPGTIQENLAVQYGVPYYTLTRLSPTHPTLIHVPGKANPLPPLGNEKFRCQIETWSTERCTLCVTRIDKPDRVTWNGKSIEPIWMPKHRVLLIPLQGEKKGILSLVSF